MKFHEAANFLFDLRRFSPRPGTDATAALLEHLDDPHDGLDCIQIAGTNGKGSTARMVESTLREAGLSVGLYTSPHLDDVRERITVDGRPLSERGLCAFVEAVEAYVTDRAADGVSPTFFETGARRVADPRTPVEEKGGSVTVELYEATVPIPVTVRGDQIRVLDSEER